MHAWRGALALLCLGLFGAGCTVETVGAPCQDDLQCPSGQHCGPLATCEAGARTVQQLGESCRTLMDELAVKASTCHGSAREAFLQASGAEALCASLERSVSEERQDFLPEAFASCLRTLREASCADVTPEALARGGLLSRCAAFAPRVAEGGACLSTADCTAGHCRTSSTCPGVCTRYVPAGGKCSATEVCTPGSSCVLGECRTDAKVAEGCSPAGVQCGADAYCGDGNTCEARKTSGACTSRGAGALQHAECAQGFRCVVASVDAGADSPRECRPARALGEACTPGALECGALLYCDAGSATCQSFPSAGAACTDPQKTGEDVGCLGARCDWASWFQRVCQPYLAAGEACQLDAQCGPTAACRGGVCTPTWCAQ